MNAARLKALRLAHGFTLDQLSDAIGGLVTKQALSKYERGTSSPSPRVVIALAKALGVKGIELAADPNMEVRVLAFRKRSTFSRSAQQAIESRVAVDLERRAELQELVGRRCAGEVLLGAFPVSTMEDAETAAEDLRDRWNLGRDPLDQMVDVLEDHCFHVLGVEAPEQFDGMSAVAEVEGRPVAVAVVSRRGVCGERQRLSLGHELGHLVTAPAEGVDEEKVAYRFGSAFLAPRDTLLREAGARRAHVTSAELFILKKRFGMSMAALVYRLHDLGVLSDRYYQEWWRYLNQMGWRKAEPEETPAEEPRWLLQSVLRATSEGLITDEHAERLLGSPLPASEGPARRRALAALPRGEKAQALRRQAASAGTLYESEPADADDEVVDY